MQVLVSSFLCTSVHANSRLLSLTALYQDLAWLSKDRKRESPAKNNCLSILFHRNCYPSHHSVNGQRAGGCTSTVISKSWLQLLLSLESASASRPHSVPESAWPAKDWESNRSSRATNGRTSRTLHRQGAIKEACSLSLALQSRWMWR